MALSVACILPAWDSQRHGRCTTAVLHPNREHASRLVLPANGRETKNSVSRSVAWLGRMGGTRPAPVCESIGNRRARKDETGDRGLLPFSTWGVVEQWGARTARRPNGFPDRRRRKRERRIGCKKQVALPKRADRRFGGTAKVKRGWPDMVHTQAHDVPRHDAVC